MPAFSTQCPNCRAKLKVAKASAIGQSLACPRCANMFVVQPLPDVPGGSSSREKKTTSSTPSQSQATHSSVENFQSQWFESDAMDDLLDGNNPSTKPSPGTAAGVKAASGKTGSKQTGSKQTGDVQDAVGKQKIEATIRSAKRRNQESIDSQNLQETLPQELGFAGLESDAASGHQAAASGVSPRPAKLAKAALAANSAPSQTAGPLNKAAGWDSQRTQQRRRVLLGIFLGIGLLSIGGSLGVYVWQNQSADPPKPPLAGADDGTNSPSLAEAGTHSDPANAAALAADKNNENAGGDQTMAPVIPSGSPDPQNAAAPLIVDTEIGSGIANAPDAKLPDAAPAQGSQEAALSVLPPIEDSGSSFSQQMSDIFGASELSNDLDSPLLAEVQQQTASDPTEAVISELANKQPNRRPSARYARPRQRSLDVDKSLNANILGISHDGMTPTQFLDLLQRLSSVPIWIDSDRFSAAPLSLTQTFPIKVINSNLLQALDKELAAMGLAYDIAPLQAEMVANAPIEFEFKGIRVFPSGSDTIVQQTYSLAALQQAVGATAAQPRDAVSAQADQPHENDNTALNPNGKAASPLADTPSPEQTLGPAIKQLIQTMVATGTWEQNAAAEPIANATDDSPLGQGGAVPVMANDPNGPAGDGASANLQVNGDQLIVAHYPHVQNQVTRLLAQLDAAIAMKEKKQPWPEPLRPRILDAGKSFTAVVDLQFHLPTFLPELFAELQSQSGMTVLIDWPALIAEGWTPDTQVPWLASNQSVEEALDHLVFDMGLTYQVIGPDVICLQSQASTEARLDVEVYPASDLLDASQNWAVLRSRLSRLLNDELAQSKAAYLYYDETFGAVIAKLPQSGHRKVALYLDTARTPDP